MIKSVLQLTVVVTALLLAICCQSQERNLNVAKSESAATAVARHAELGVWGVDLSARKESIKDGDNFFEYANGTWLDTFEIPADKSIYGAITLLSDRSPDQTKASSMI